MKARPIIFLIFVIGLFLFPSLIQAQLYTSKQNKMSVQGTSTIHDWESEVTKVECKCSMSIISQNQIEISDMLVKIPVTSIKSTKGKIMDEKTYEAFNSDKHPYIQYKLGNAKTNGKGSDFMITATGELTMAGTTRTIEITAKAKMLPNGDLQINASKKLNMRDYNMVPPTALMGTIKVGEEITVVFDIILTPGNTVSTLK